MTDDQVLRPWTIHGSRSVYESPWVRVSLDDVELPDGRRLEHHVVNLPRVAIAMIVDAHERVLMLWRYRFAVRAWGYELLGGLVEPGEDPAATAAREAEEESGGWRPVGEPQHLVGFEPLPGMISGRIDVYLWRAAQKVSEPSDPEEAGRLEWVEPERLAEMVTRQELLGSGTWVAVLRYLGHRSR